MFRNQINQIIVIIVDTCHLVYVFSFSEWIAIRSATIGCLTFAEAEIENLRVRLDVVVVIVVVIQSEVNNRV